MNQVFIRRKTDGTIKGPLEVDFAFQQLNNSNTSFDMYSISVDQEHWQEAQIFFQPYMNSVLKKTKRLHQKTLNNQFGKYQILSELGRGGMGVVYLVYDPEFERKCALKVLLFNKDKRAHQRFAIEARAMARFKNKNIVKIYDIKEQPKQYFVMEYIEGRPFNKVLEKSRLTLNEKLNIFCQICDGVAYAHREKIIHRDLKPANIILDQDSVPKILDFGIAKQVAKEIEITKTGELVGTPKYLAPELIRGERASYKSDLYALAVILYEILAGQPPFEASSVVELMYSISRKNPIVPSEINPKVSFELDLLCMKCLDKDPVYRLESVAFLRKEVQRFLNNKPILTKEFSYLYRAKKWLQRNQLLAGITLSVMCLLLTVIIVLRFALTTANEKHQQAKEKLQKAYLETTQNFIEKALYHKALEKINEVYKIQKVQPQKKYLQKANFLLRYSILPSLPKVQTYQNELAYKAMFSPSGTYIYIQDEKDLYFWEERIALQQGIKKSNHYMKIPFKDSQITIQFAQSTDSFILYNKSCVEFYHLPTKKKDVLFEFSGTIITQISNDAKYLAFMKSHQKKGSELFLHDIPSKKTKKLSSITSDFRSLLFSKDNKWLVYTGNNRNQTLNYISHIFHVKTGREFKDSAIKNPFIKFSEDSKLIYMNNRAWLSLDENASLKFSRIEDDAATHEEAEGNYMILAKKRIYQAKNSEIVQYDEISKTKTKFNLSIPQAYFDSTQNFLIAKTASSSVLWSMNSNKLCYVYHIEKNKSKLTSQNLHFIFQSSVFYTNTLNNEELIAFHPFPNTKTIDFLSKKMMKSNKMLKIERNTDGISNVVIDSSNKILNILVKRVKNKEGLFSNISIYNDHPVVCKNNFFALLAKGSLIIYDQKTQKRFFMLLPASKFIAINIQGDYLYYLQSQYAQQGVIGKIALSKLKNVDSKNVVGYEKRLQHNVSQKSQLCFIEDKIFISDKNYMVVLNQQFENQKKTEVVGLAITVHNKKLYAVGKNHMEVFQLKNSELLSLKKSIANINDKANRIVISSSGKYIAIATKKHVFLSELVDDQILNTRSIHAGNVSQLLFHPQKDILSCNFRYSEYYYS
ncbi:protein kinase [Candidatus Uabimicrobium sp. HlEnr_7]|uniref:serine/threonine protein kinase n=1 Tax=Candidatus Uabimicrobium helgolandensis TaxID=3095367 RepID=UPI003558D9A8